MNINPDLTSHGVATYDPNRPLFAGWPFLRWLTDTCDEINEQGAIFHGDGDIHRSYEREGITGAIARAEEGLTICRKLTRDSEDAKNFEWSNRYTNHGAGWYLIREALYELGQTTHERAGL